MDARQSPGSTTWPLRLDSRTILSYRPVEDQLLTLVLTQIFLSAAMSLGTNIF